MEDGDGRVIGLMMVLYVSSSVFIGPRCRADVTRCYGPGCVNSVATHNGGEWKWRSSWASVAQGCLTCMEGSKANQASLQCTNPISCLLNALLTSASLFSSSGLKSTPVRHAQKSSTICCTSSSGKAIGRAMIRKLKNASATSGYKTEKTASAIARPPSFCSAVQ